MSDEIPADFEKSVDDGDVSVLLSNRNGAYAWFSDVPASRYNGLFFRQNGRMIKLIESFAFASPITAITARLWGVTVKRNELSQTMFMPLRRDALVVEFDSVAEFDVFFDVKIGEDNRVWGRDYEISNDAHCVVVKFSKKNDARDDNSVFCEQFDVYLAIFGDGLEYLPLQSWDEHFYRYDESRNSPPFNRWVFKACRLRVKEFVCAWSSKKSDAVSSARDVFESRDRLRREREIHAHSLVAKIPKISSPEISLAYQCSLVALDSLIVGDEKIVAGLPWFYQRWARDEIICTKSLMLQKNYVFAKKLLFDHLSRLGKGCWLPNMFDVETSLLSADAVGWLFFRLDELLHLTARNNFVSKKEKSFVAERLQFCLSAIEKSCFVDGLVRTNAMETWMDTEFGGDTRNGATIEIQAMVFFMCKMLKRLSGKKSGLESVLADAVRKNFVKGKFLLDVAGQQTLRPNVFIAAYVCPELFSAKEWEVFFDSLIPRLWLDWGGFSSIDKKHSLFVDKYSGEDNKSYHRGDSWFWLNNLAAIVLHRINSKKYASYISKIIDASTAEILYKGATGFASELSSAGKLSSDGCIAQAWSSALFIELVNELFVGKKK